MALYYDEDTDWPVEVYDNVVVVAGDLRIPAMVKKIMTKSGRVQVSFEGVDPILDLIVLRKTATVPMSAIELVGRSM